MKTYFNYFKNTISGERRFVFDVGGAESTSSGPSEGKKNGEMSDSEVLDEMKRVRDVADKRLAQYSNNAEVPENIKGHLVRIKALKEEIQDRLKHLDYASVEMAVSSLKRQLDAIANKTSPEYQARKNGGPDRADRVAFANMSGEKPVKSSDNSSEYAQAKIVAEPKAQEANVASKKEATKKPVSVPNNVLVAMEASYNRVMSHGAATDSAKNDESGRANIASRLRPVSDDDSMRNGLNFRTDAGKVDIPTTSTTKSPNITAVSRDVPSMPGLRFANSEGPKAQDQGMPNLENRPEDIGQKRTAVLNAALMNNSEVKSALDDSARSGGEAKIRVIKLADISNLTEEFKQYDPDKYYVQVRIVNGSTIKNHLDARLYRVKDNSIQA